MSQTPANDASMSPPPPPPVALQKLPEWFWDAFGDCLSGMWNLFPYGLMAIMALVASWAIEHFILVIAGGGFFSFILAPIIWLGTGVVVGWFLAGLGGICLARIHGRKAYLSDFMMDTDAVLKGVAFFAIVKLYYSFLGALILGMGGMGNVLINREFGLNLLGLVIMLVGIFISTFFFFAFPLMLDRKLDPVSAIKESAMTVQSDIMGLAVTNYLFHFGIALTYSISCCICLIPQAFFIPLYMAFMLRVYKDYFDLSEDRFLNREETEPSSYGVLFDDAEMEYEKWIEGKEPKNHRDGEFMIDPVGEIDLDEPDKN